MSRSASVKSVDAVRAFKAELKEYQASVRQVWEQLVSETRRGSDWVESDRTAYWPAQVRKASNVLAEARIQLECRRLAATSELGHSCYDERKAVERAKARMEYADQQTRTTKYWLREVRQKSDEFESHLARLAMLAEQDLPRALAALERIEIALDKYTERPATQTPVETDANDEDM